MIEFNLLLHGRSTFPLVIPMSETPASSTGKIRVRLEVLITGPLHECLFSRSLVAKPTIFQV